MKIAINGAGVAGPALAFWLLKGCDQVLLVEQAPEIRRGGYVIDFWGLGYDIAEKMGLVPQIPNSAIRSRRSGSSTARPHVGGFWSKSLAE